MIGTQFTHRGFLPEPDPLVAFPADSEFSALDALGHDLPSRLQDKGFRTLARGLVIPPLPRETVPRDELRLYYVRLGFLASAYVNQVGQDPATVLPRNMAVSSL